MDASMTGRRDELLAHATSTAMAGDPLGGPYPLASIGPAASSAGGVAPARVVLTGSAATAATPPVRRKRGRPRDPLADGRILSAASSLILLRGFDAMTVDEVAATAGVGKATVYRRWSKKEDLAVAAMERLYSDEMPVPDTGTLRGDLTEVYRGQLSFAQSQAGADYMRTLVRESMRDDRMAALYRTAHEQAERNAREIFHRAAQRGEIGRETPVDLVVSLLSGLVVLSTVMGRDAPSSLEVDRLVDLVLQGLGVHPGSEPARDT